MVRATDALVSVDGPGGLIRLVVVVVGCAGLAALINRWGRLGHGSDSVLSALRASLQLTVVGLLIAAVLGSWWLTLAFIALMLSVASLTAGRRLAREGDWWLAGAPVVLGAVPVAGGLLLSGLVPYEPIAVVPVVGILIGGAMTATTLAGKRAWPGPDPDRRPGHSSRRLRRDAARWRHAVAGGSRPAGGPGGPAAGAVHRGARDRRAGGAWKVQRRPASACHKLTLPAC